MKRLTTCGDIRIFRPGDKLIFGSKFSQARNLYKSKKTNYTKNSYKIYSNCFSTLAKLINLI